jgi:hypothetical protein
MVLALRPSDFSIVSVQKRTDPDYKILKNRLIQKGKYDAASGLINTLRKRERPVVEFGHHISA